VISPTAVTNITTPSTFQKNILLVPSLVAATRTQKVFSRIIIGLFSREVKEIGKQTPCRGEGVKAFFLTKLGYFLRK
jgi:hypothetical protein